MTGKKCSEKHKKNIRIAVKKYIKENNPKHLFKKGNIPPNKGIKGSKTGNKNGMWKGGKTKIRCFIPSLPEYEKWRSEVFARDNWTCQTCHRRGYFLEAHHIKRLSIIIEEHKLTRYNCIKCKELWNVDNGVTLCKECHNLTKGEIQ